MPKERVTLYTGPFNRQSISLTGDAESEVIMCVDPTTQEIEVLHIGSEFSLEQAEKMSASEWTRIGESLGGVGRQEILDAIREKMTILA